MNVFRRYSGWQRLAVLCPFLTCLFPISISIAVGQTLNVAVPHYPRLNPNEGFERYVDIAVRGAVFETLVRLNAAGVFESVLAEQWSFEANGVLLVKLRKSVRFHDGSLVTAEDIQQSLVRAKDPASHQRTRFSGINRIDIIDSHSFRIIPLDRGDVLIPLAWLYVTRQSSRSLLGTGPYKFVEGIPDNSVKLARYSDWWNGAVNTAEVVVRVAPVASNRDNELLAGQVHLILESEFGDHIAGDRLLDRQQQLIRAKQQVSRHFGGFLATAPKLELGPHTASIPVNWGNLKFKN